MSYGSREPEPPFGGVGHLALVPAGQPPRHDPATDYVHQAACGCRVTFHGRRRCLDWTAQWCLLHARPEGAGERRGIVLQAQAALDASVGADDKPMSVEEYLLRVGSKNAPVPRDIIEADRRRAGR